MSPITGAPAQKKRAMSRIKCMIQSPKTQCCASLRTMSALLRGPNTEPRASTKLDETLGAKGGPGAAVCATRSQNGGRRFPVKCANGLLLVQLSSGWSALRQAILVLKPIVDDGVRQTLRCGPAS